MRGLPTDGNGYAKNDEKMQAELAGTAGGISGAGVFVGCWRDLRMTRGPERGGPLLLRPRLATGPAFSWKNRHDR
jgi:hypothetical protein